MRSAMALQLHVFVGLAAVLWAGLIGIPESLTAQETDEKTKDVPLKRIVLFTSGVGYFQHGGSVEDTATVDLKFNVEDINDLLKSMVVQDLGGGQVRAVNYGSRDPITKTLKTFAVDLTEEPSLGDLLRQIRGEKIEVEAPNKIVGTIVGLEERRRKVADGEILTEEILNVLTDDGLRSVSLQQIGHIKLLDEELNNELHRALAILARGNSTDKKTVSLKFTGEGQRPVSIGYIQETPVWKTSYRLVLSEEEKPYLQGWAIVENQTESDWANVKLRLVSGRPISFIMDLYQPLYVDRPEVAPELYSSLRPPEHEEKLAEKSKRMAEAQRRRNAAAAQRAPASESRGLSRDASPPPPAAKGGGSGGDKMALFDRKQMQQTAQSLAQAGEVGELFQYQIDAPVTLERQRSAMLPIVGATVEGEKVSIYNPSVHKKHPLNGLRLTNATDLHLMQGPITVFDEGTYAGDARLPDIEPGSERLISYAMDLETEVVSRSKSHPQQLVGVRIDHGVLYASRKYRRSRDYTVKNSGLKPKTVLIEQPIDDDWKLLQPEEADEKTRSLYRFAVEADPGAGNQFTVTEERVMQRTVHLTNVNTDRIQIYLKADVVGEDVKEALREVIRRKQELSRIIAERKRYEQKIQSITDEQDRIRKNMAQLDRNTDLYNRYVKKFTEQENEIEELRGRIEQLKNKEQKAQQELNEYLSNLEID